jgi:hypothetical protein
VQEGLKLDRQLGIVYVDLMGPLVCPANGNLYSMDIIDDYVRTGTAIYYYA